MTGMKSLGRGLFWLVAGIGLALLGAVIVIGPALLLPGVGILIMLAIMLWASWPGNPR